ncbi:MAG: GNAT family N-acetyltransferase [Lachnospiraceae bacterium]|nr:GNAT family N-acetyltransferase [Lachnospiraceae bacterium]
MIIDVPKGSQLPALRNLWQEAFGDTEEFLNTFFATAFSADRCRIATENGTVAAMLYWFDCLFEDRPVAYVYAVATAKAFRGQGLCHKLLADTHRHLEARGYAGTVLVPGSESLFRFYKAMGYEAFGGLRELSCDRAETSVSLTEIDKTEYAALRRKLLPKGGILQEKENLDFLETQATFYKGSDFLLAARTEGDTLYGIELLGNKTAAAGIVCALGCKKGQFRTPGTEKDRPFAMYRPIKKEFRLRNSRAERGRLRHLPIARVRIHSGAFFCCKGSTFLYNKKGGPMPTYFGFAFE